MAGKTYNHVVLVGRLGADPQFRSTTTGKSVCNFNLATNRREKDETTDWHRIELWDNLADIANRYLKKGSQVLIEGRIANDNYEKNGVKHYSYKIVATNMMMLDSRKIEENNNIQDKEVNYNYQNQSDTQDEYFEDEIEENKSQSAYELQDENDDDEKEIPF